MQTYLEKQVKYKTEEHIKNKAYNYYKINIKGSDDILDENINDWLNNPSNLFPSTLNSYTHVEKSKINYKPVIIT